MRITSAGDVIANGDGTSGSSQQHRGYMNYFMQMIVVRLQLQIGSILYKNIEGTRGF